jgi:hypothetical protein
MDGPEMLVEEISDMWESYSVVGEICVADISDL